jgi:carbonic anhydrase
MPVCTSIERKYPDGKYDAPKKYVLVLSCVDYRLLDDLIRFLDHDNLTNRYYHVALAGAALGVVPESKSGPQAPAVAGPHWRETFRGQVRAAVYLTHGELTDIYIVQHENCGAFNAYVPGFEAQSSDEQREINEQYARALLTHIREYFCTEYNAPIKEGRPEMVQKVVPKVHAFYMDLRGNVTHIDSGTLVVECANHHCHCAKLPEVAPVAPAHEPLLSPPPPAKPPKPKNKK